MDIPEKVAYIPGEAKLWSNLTGGQVMDLLLDIRGKKAGPFLERSIEKRVQYLLGQQDKRFPTSICVINRRLKIPFDCLKDLEHL